MNTQVAKFSVVTPGQFKFMKPVAMAIFIVVPDGDPDLTIYSEKNKFLRLSQPEQENNASGFPTPKNPGKTEDHTPIQTRILTELLQMKEEDKLNPREDIKSSSNFLERFDWTEMLLIKTKKQSIEVILDFFAQTLKRDWNEHGVQGETHPKSRQSCLQPKSANDNPPERRPNHWR